MRKYLGKLVALFTVTMALTLCVGAQKASAATKLDSLKDKSLKAAYERVIAYADDLGIELGMTYDDFAAGYQGQGVLIYENSFYKVLVAPEETSAPQLKALPSARSASSSSSSSSSGGGKYYYNTGTSCPSSATYSRYRLLSTVKKGDIIFEANGGFGITGHIAIVEGIYTRSNGTKYIRLIEAIDVGVVRSILDDKRCDDKAVTVLRVKNATTSQINAAVSFCVGELGSKYMLDFQKDTSSSETDWYCSELVWAAYKNQGIDLEVSGINEPGITPRDIKRCNKVTTISYK